MCNLICNKEFIDGYHMSDGKETRSHYIFINQDALCMGTGAKLHTIMDKSVYSYVVNFMHPSWQKSRIDVN